MSAARSAGVEFSRDEVRVNGTVYRSVWKKDFTVVLNVSGIVYVMGTHRFGTQAGLIRDIFPQGPVLLRS